MDSAYISEHITCTKEEKLKCLKTANKVNTLSEIARREGLLALEEEAKKEEYKAPALLNLMMNLVVDGTDPELIQSIIENYMLSSPFSNLEFLDNMVAWIGIAAMQKGENSSVIAEKMCSLFGFDFRETYYDWIGYKDYSFEFTELVEIIEQKLASFEKLPFLDWIPEQLDDNSMQRLLREIPIPLLDQALVGSSKSVIVKFLKNTSKSNQILIFDNITHIKAYHKELAEKSQKKIIETIHKLKDMAEIILIPDIQKKFRLSKEEINKLLEGTSPKSEEEP